MTQILYLTTSTLTPMSSTVCPKCGKETEKLYGHVCEECFFKGFDLAQLPLVLHAKICSRCGARFYRGKWQNTGSIEDAVIKTVEDSLLVHDDADNIEVYIEPRQLNPSMYRIHVDVSANVVGEPVQKELGSEVRIIREACDMCSRISGGYFEGIIQIRGTNRIPNPEEISECIRIANMVVRRMQKKGDRLAFIGNSMELKEGVDLYIGSNNTARHICKEIVSELGGSFSESPTLFGRKDGKDVYRITFAMRLPEFMPGDIVHYRGRIIEIKTSSKRINGIDLSTGSRFTEFADSMEGSTRIAKRSDAVMSVLVAEEDEDLMVLDPVTYETVTIKKPMSFKAEPGTEIPVIKTEYGLFALPGENSQ